VVGNLLRIGPTTYMALGTTDSRRSRERRKAQRYDICLNLRYVLQRRGSPPITGSGTSINVSLSGLLFQGETNAQTGDSLLAIMDWPVKGPDAEALILVATGVVLRNRKPQTAASLTTTRLLPARDIEHRFRPYFALFGDPIPTPDEVSSSEGEGTADLQNTETEARLYVTI
jgi:hypothetical protein